MKTIKSIYKRGMGPSSSHTMAPHKAATEFARRNPNAHSFRITLYGSLAATGKGHLTDVAIISGLSPKNCDIIWEAGTFLPYHPNGMLFEALDVEKNITDKWEVFSIGGGELRSPDMQDETPENKQIYPHSKFSDIKKYCKTRDLLLYEYVEKYEGSDIWDYLKETWDLMQKTIKKGLATDGRLPGILRLPRKAGYFYNKAQRVPLFIRDIVYLSSYALACSEENASGGQVVTAPTCGSCGVVPAVLYDWQLSQKAQEKDILRALATAGLIGNLIRENGSISGAEVGCQGEVGTACAMAAAALAQLMEPVFISAVEYAAEMGVEHHLGLTCDPIAGLVQIPCIERNAMGALRAKTCATYSLVSGGRHRIRFDTVVRVMKETGLDLKSCYKETSCGGLAEELDGAVK